LGEIEDCDIGLFDDAAVLVDDFSHAFEQAGFFPNKLPRGKPRGIRPDKIE
jgi:hypothetical protein